MTVYEYLMIGMLSSLRNIGLIKDINTYEDVYNKHPFYIPKIVCNDGFEISFQIHNFAYCSSNNGHQKFGKIKTLEWGYPSEDHNLLLDSAEDKSDIINTVGKIDIDLAEKLIENHGGINLDSMLKSPIRSY